MLAAEKDLLCPISKNDSIQREFVQLRNIRNADGQDITAPTVYQWLCAAVLRTHTDPRELMPSLGSWSTISDGTILLREMGMAHALLTGTSPDNIPITRSIRMELLKRAPVSVKPCLISTIQAATGNVGALVTAMKDLETMPSGPSVRMVNKGKSAKSKGSTAQVTRKQMWHDLLQAGVPRSELSGLSTAELFRCWQKLTPTAKSQPSPARQPPRTLPPPRLPLRSKALLGSCLNSVTEGSAGPPRLPPP